MRLSCAIATRILGSRATGERSPVWVTRHVSGCERCRSEAEAQARVRTALQTAAGGTDETDLSWAKLRATLPERQAHRLNRVPAFAAAAVGTVVIAAVCIGLSTQSGRGVTSTPIARQASVKRSAPIRPQKEIARNVPAPKQPILEKIKLPPAPRQDFGVRKALPHVKPWVVAPRHHRPARPDDATRWMVRKPEFSPKPDSPSYTVVAAEEHVIDVVGVGRGADQSDSGTGYVIRTTDTGDDHQVTLL